MLPRDAHVLPRPAPHQAGKPKGKVIGLTPCGCSYSCASHLHLPSISPVSPLWPLHAVRLQLACSCAPHATTLCFHTRTQTRPAPASSRPRFVDQSSLKKIEKSTKLLWNGDEECSDVGNKKCAYASIARTRDRLYRM